MTEKYDHNNRHNEINGGKRVTANETTNEQSVSDLIEVCVAHMANEAFPSEQVRAYMKEMPSKLDYWKKYKNLEGAEKFEEFKTKLFEEINALGV